MQKDLIPRVVGNDANCGRAGGLACHLLLALLTIALVACEDRSVNGADANVPSCVIQTAPFDLSESPPTSETSSGPFAFGGFRFGDDPALVEQTVRDRYPDYAISRADCSTALQLRAGDHSRDDGRPVCNKLGPTACELYNISLRKREGGVPLVSSFNYIARFAEPRETQRVIEEMEAAYGKPFWQFSTEKSSGWPGVRLESSLVWTDRTDVPPERFRNQRFANGVYDTLGHGKFFIVRLVHGTEDTNTANAMTIDAFVRPK